MAINRGRLGEADGLKAIEYLTSFGVELRPFGDLIDATFRLTRRYDISPYDSAYLALAEKEMCDFYTGDRKLFGRAGVHFSWMKWIGEYRSGGNSLP